MRPGECNKHGQELLEKVDLPSRSHPYARLWRMRCTTCDSVHECNSCDAHLRRCPFCQHGQPPEPLPEGIPGLVPGTQAQSTTRVRRRAAVQRPSTELPEPPVVRRGDSQATCFDAYIMVDWSATNGALGTDPVPNAPWVAEAWWNGCQLDWWPQRGYFRTRRLCINHLLERLRNHVKEKRRVLSCFDFAYGYPTGYGRALGLGGQAFWTSIWGEISVPTALQGMPVPPPQNEYASANNRNNRFEVASHLNHRVNLGGQPRAGPLYGCPAQNQTPFFTQASPGFPYAIGPGGALGHFRVTDQRLLDRGHHPLCCWWVLGGRAPVVGGQILTGIPAVKEIRNHPEFSKISKVWPFETGFTPSPSAGGTPCIIHAEIWPGIVNDQLQDGLIRDEAQVRAMVKWAASQDAESNFGVRFAVPEGLDDGQVSRCRHEEGWILGSG